jgi:hypothetical protein
MERKIFCFFADLTLAKYVAFILFMTICSTNKNLLSDVEISKIVGIYLYFVYTMNPIVLIWYFTRRNKIDKPLPC